MSGAICRLAFAIRVVLVSFAVSFGLLPLNPANAVVVTWADASSTGVIAFLDSSNFDNAFITFPEFTSSQLTSVSGPGYFHDHPGNSGQETMYLDLRLGGAWTEVFTFSTLTTDDLLLSSFIPNIAFAPGVIDGLRLRTFDGDNQAFHDMDGTQFQFQTPLPAALPLFLTGLVALGLIGRRRRARRPV